MKRLLFIAVLISTLFAQTYDSEIQPIWSNNCTSCHVSGHSSGLDLTSGNSYNNIVNKASNYGGQIVKPGDPANSSLFQKIVGNSSFGDRMPLGGSQLAQADIDKINKWITEGAKQDLSSASGFSFDFGPHKPQIVVDPPIEGEQNWSIEAWLKFHQKPASGQWLSVFYFDDNVEVLTELMFNGDDNEFSLHYKGANAIKFTDDSVFDNNWHHFYVSGNGSKIELYLNGNKKGETNYTGAFISSDRKMIWGVNLDGSMDEVRIRNNSDFLGVPGSKYNGEEGTLLIWNFDDQSTTQATDVSGQNNHGAINGQAAYEPDVYSGRGDFSITVKVELDEELANGQVWFGVWEVGQDPENTQPIHNHQMGEDPPFVRSYGLNWTLIDGKSYFIEGFFDVNANNTPDENDPQGRSQDFSWPPSQPVYLFLEDMSGPTIDISSISGTTDVVEGANVTITLNIDSPHGVQTAEIEYYVGGVFDAQTSGMSNTGGNTWQGSISSSDVTSSGLLFEIRAVDDRGRESYSGIDDIRIDFDELDLSSTPSESYVMISAPGQLDNASISGVLDELGEADPKEWRFFRWTGSGYQENSGSFTHGKSYWLITKEAENISADAGSSTSLINSSTISLSAGWNMIATPFDFSIGISDKGIVIDGDIEPVLHQYDGTSYTTTTRLNPGEGAWVFANGSAQIKFDFVGLINGDFSELNDNGDEINSGWKANMIAKVGAKQDVINVFGTHPEANDEWDHHDRREPPVIGDYISVAFENSAWSRRGGRYSQDIRSDGNQIQSWTLAARTNIKGIVGFSLEDLDAIPSYQDIRLVDTALGLVYNLRSEKEVTFTSQGSENPYYFQLIVGAADDIQSELDEMDIIPNSFELAQNTPNPFNPVTNIRISLVEDAIITLKVYNLLGEEMNALAFNQSLGKGNHSFIWAGRDDNGRQLPSGVYLYRLEVNSNNGASQYRDTKKMVLMK